MLYGALLFAALLVRIYGSVTGYIEPSESKRYVETLRENLKSAGEDIASVYNSVAGLKLLKESIGESEVKSVCNQIKKIFKPDGTPETIFYGLSAWNLLQCPGKLQTDATINTLNSIIKNEKSSIADLRYALEALKLSGQNIPNAAKLAQLIQDKLKEDDSFSALGHALHADAILGTAGKFTAEKIQEIISQADEVDGKILQWEGGLSTTALILTGILRGQNVKPFTPAISDKFATYLMSRKTVQSAKGIFSVLQAASALVESQSSPVSITIAGSSIVTIEKPELKLRITDLFGRPLKTALTPVVAQSATRVTDDVVVLSKQPLSPGSKAGEYVLSLRTEPGQYRIQLSAGSHSTSFTVRVVGPIKLEHVEIGLSDADGTSAPRLTKVAFPSKLTSPLKADSNHRLIVRFPLTQTVHQAFLRLYEGKKEIIFIAERDSAQLYKIDVGLTAELSYSGTYEIELIIGDSIISNPIRWVIGTIEADLLQQQPKPAQLRTIKPEIQHLFRPAEKRPPQPVSMLFTGLAVAPLALLLILWSSVGINFGNFTVLAIPFHLGLGAILGLFTLFWLKLDMFTTCAWLIPIGGFTFLSGNRLLRLIANRKGEK